MMQITEIGVIGLAVMGEEVLPLTWRTMDLK